VNNVSIAAVLQVLEDTSTGAHKNATLYAAGDTKLDYLVRSVLFALKIPSEKWEEYKGIVAEAFDRWHEQRAAR
jgi:hypothetical protein